MFVNYTMYKLLPILLFAYGLAVTTEDIYDNSWALIIGINKYENVQKLDFAADDAIAMKEILIESFNFPEDNITMLLNQEATKDNIVKEFSNIAFKAQERDRVLVFFAGHGETMELPEGGQMGYLIPVNGDADNLYYSSIRMDELKSLALMSKAKHMLYLVDACYGGIAAVGSRGLSTNTPNYIDKIVSDKARQIITAGGKGEQVIEKSEWGHSAFTLNLKRGLKDGRADLNSDGYITANELGMFLSEKVTIDSDNQQTPQYGRMTSQEGEFVFIIDSNIQSNEGKEKNIDVLPEINLEKLAEKLAEKLKVSAIEENIADIKTTNDNQSTSKIISLLDEARNKFSQNIINIDFEYLEKYPNRRTKIKGENFDYEIQDGYWIYYWKNGRKEFEMFYKDGDEHGYYVTYYESGGIESESTFNYGLREGPSLLYNEDGSLDEFSMFINNKRHGPFIAYHPNGVILEEKEFVNGMAQGTRINYFDSGQIEFIVNVVDDLDHGEYTSYHLSGNIKEKGYLNNNEVEGTVTNYYDTPNQNIKKIEEFNEDVANGPSTWYFINGEKSDEGYFLNGKLDGEYLWYDEDGNLIEIAYYDNGLKEGPYQAYYATGEINKTGNYTKDVLKGPAIEYHPNGTIESKGKYKNDNKTGVWKYYDESGELIEKKRHKNK